MTRIDTMIAALFHYGNSADCYEAGHTDEVKEALGTCFVLKERMMDQQVAGVTTVSDYTLTTMLNLITYDDFGIIAKRHGNSGSSLQFESYEMAVRAKYDFDDLTRGQLRDAFCYLHDLWGDNELDGAHNEDGTFNYHPRTQR